MPAFKAFTSTAASDAKLHKFNTGPGVGNLNLQFPESPVEADFIALMNGAGVALGDTLSFTTPNGFVFTSTVATDVSTGLRTVTILQKIKPETLQVLARPDVTKYKPGNIIVVDTGAFVGTWIANDGDGTTPTAWLQADLDAYYAGSAGGGGGGGVMTGADIKAAYEVEPSAFTDLQFTKLAAIEAGATADMTGAEIKAAYQAQANAFTDAQFTKLAGVETGATADMTGAEIKTAYQSQASAFTDAQFTKLAGIETGATADMTGAEIKTAYQAQPSAFTDAQFTKLSGIEAGATADMTGAEIKTAYQSQASAFTDAQFTKLAGITAGATANDTNANLRDRSTHTGTQLLATISNAGTLAAKNTVALATDVSGVLPVANFATGVADGTKFVRDDGTLQSIPAGGGLLPANNLSDVSNATTARDNLGVEIGVDVQAYSAVLAGTTSSFLAADRTKLDGIEALATADMTGAEIKTAYQAQLNAFTDALFTKLSGIEALATADQTGAEIKAAYQAETSAFTDALFTKLSGIEALATADQTGAEIKTLYQAETNAFTDALFTKLSGIEALATADMTGAEIKAAYQSETSAFTDALFTKLSAIAAGATANSTDATLLDRANHTGTQLLATISDAGTLASKNAVALATDVTGDNTAFNKNFGAVAGTVTEGNDARLSDARAPTAHTHTKANITDFVETDYATGAEGDLAASALQNITGESVGDLSDVDVTTVAPTNGQALVYVTANSRWEPVTVAAGGVTDHGALTGLADDDHAQYHNDTRGDARYYTQTAADALLAGKEPTITPATAFNKAFGAVAGTVTEGNDARLSNARTPTAHVHDAADVTTGTFADARISAASVTQHNAALTVTESQISDLGTYETAFAKNTGFNKAFGSTTGTVAQGDDARFTDARTPTAHTHVKANITDFVETDYATGAEGDLAVSALQDITGESIQSLSDVATSMTPADGQVLTFDTTNGWQAETIPAGVTDHGLLSGLADDDHTQYHTDARGDARYSALVHAHAAADVTSGTFADARISATSVTQHNAALTVTESQISDLGTYETAFAKNTGFNKNFGAVAGTVAQGDDARFTDARAPTAHTHVKADITDFNGADYATAAQGALAATALQSFTETNDLSTAVTWANVPNANITAGSVTQHQAALSITESQISDLGTYEPAFAKSTGFNKAFGSTTGTVAQGDDARFTDARAPTAHAHAAADVTSGTFANAQISAASVTQHQAALAITESQISDLGTYETAFVKSTGFNKNFGNAAGTVTEGNDARLSDARVPTAHTHLKAGITDFVEADYATAAQGVKADAAAVASRGLVAGAGLTGGGDLTADRTFDIVADNTLTINANDIAVRLDPAGNLSSTAAGIKVTVNPANGRGAIDPTTDGGDSLLPTAAGPDTTVNNGTAIAFGDYYMVTTAGTINGAFPIATGELPGLFIYNGGVVTTNAGWSMVKNTDTNGLALKVRDLVAGAGLTGGGDLTADRTFNVGGSDSITVNADDIAVKNDTTSGGTIIPLSITGNGVGVETSSLTPGTRSIVAGAGLTGGGDLTADRTINVVSANSLTVTADNIEVKADAATGGNVKPVSVTANGVGFDVSGLSVDTRSLVAGAGLTGGGDLTADRTFDIVGGNSITVNPNNIEIKNDTTSAGTIKPLSITANGVGVDASALGVDLGYTLSATTGVVTNSVGTDATIPLADGTNSGLLPPAIGAYGFLRVNAAGNAWVITNSSGGTF